MADMELDLEGQFDTENLTESLGEGLFETDFDADTDYDTEADALGEGLFDTDTEQFGDHDFDMFAESDGEQFFGNVFKGLGGLAKKALPVLKKVAGVAAPIIGNAVGGPLGGKIGCLSKCLLSESEAEGDFEIEGDNEADYEAVMSGPLSEQAALGELMAAAASKAVTDLEADAQIGASTMIILTPEERDLLRAVLPSMNRGVAALTRILRRRRDTAPAVRVVPAIVRRTVVTLKKQAATGQPVTKAAAGRAIAKQTRKVLGNPAICTRAIHRNVKATKAVAQKIRSTPPRRPTFSL